MGAEAQSSLRVLESFEGNLFQSESVELPPPRMFSTRGEMQGRKLCFCSMESHRPAENLNREVRKATTLKQISSHHHHSVTRMVLPVKTALSDKLQARSYAQ